MKPASNFEAFWLPAFDSPADPDEVLAVGFEWLRRAESTEGVRGVIAMYSASMRRNRPAIAAAPWRSSPLVHARDIGSAVQYLRSGRLRKSSSWRSKWPRARRCA